VIFRYTRYEVDPSPGSPERTILYRPVIPVRFLGPKASRDFYALLDTGADESYITESLAAKIGVIPLSDETSVIHSASGGLLAIYGSITVEVADDEEVYSFNIPIGIVSEDWSEAILGHTFLEYFDATFSYRDKLVTLTRRHR
jgi:predicted aspartyl protease